MVLLFINTDAFQVLSRVITKPLVYLQIPISIFQIVTGYKGKENTGFNSTVHKKFPGDTEGYQNCIKQ